MTNQRIPSKVTLGGTNEFTGLPYGSTRKVGDPKATSVPQSLTPVWMTDSPSQHPCTLHEYAIRAELIQLAMLGMVVHDFNLSTQDTGSNTGV